MIGLRFIYAASVALALTGCGVGYIPAKVDVSADNVTVVPLTNDSVQAANQNAYVPKQIPDAFFQNAGSPSAFRGAGPAPLPSLTEQQRPTVLTTRLPPVTAPSPYRIGVGDVVLLATRSSAGTVEELSGLLAAQNSRQGYTVQDDGAIAVPDVGRVVLEGLTLEGAEAQLFQSLVENRIDPTFSLEIVEFNSKRVSIGGAVGTPAIVPITLTPLFLDEALTLSGGISTPDVDFASIRIYRDGSLYQIPLVQYLREPNLQKTRLVAGDNVFVDTEFELNKASAYFQEQITLSQFRQQGRVQALAELNTEISLRRAALAELRSNFQERVNLNAVDRDYVYLTGEFTQPGRFELPFGRQATLADALYSDGGFSSNTANPSQIYVLRGAGADTAMVTALHLDASDASNLVLATRLNLRANDIVFIAEQPITRWNRAVQQLVPSLITTGVGLARN
jgi:polysaccharide export outer membrane protein